MDYAEKAMELHRKLRGKLEMHTRTETGTREALSIAYTPGVAAPCLAIKEDPAQSYELTRRWNTVAARDAPSLGLCSSRTREPSFRQTAPSAPMAHCSPL